MQQNTIQIILNKFELSSTSIQVDKKLISRYKLHLKEKQKNQVSDCQKSFDRILSKISFFIKNAWRILMPNKIRGIISQKQKFRNYCTNDQILLQFGKIFNHKDYSQNLNQKQVILGLLYEHNQKFIQIFQQIVSNQQLKEILSKYTPCFIQLQPQNKEIFLGNQNYKSPMIVVLSKTIFDEIVILDRFEIKETLILSKRIESAIEDHLSLQTQIINASKQVSLTENEKTTTKSLKNIEIPKILSLDNLESKP